MSFSAIIQARMSSTRLPKKILLQYKKISPLDFLIKRLKKSKYLKDIIVATTKKKIDNKIVNFCKKKKIKYFRGDENNVLSRYYKIAKQNKSKIIIRITGDCPFVDYRIIDKFIEKIDGKKNNTKFDYVSNTLKYTYPDGFDVEVYVQDSNESHFSSGVYSVLYDEWLVKPKHEKIDVDKKILKDTFSPLLPDSIVNRKKEALKNPEIKKDKIEYRDKAIQIFLNSF